MGFLWQLLPGAREARNQVIVGYAWLLGLALLFGTPMIEKGSHLEMLISSLGSIGVGVGLSFAAFLIGSFSDDLASALLGTRGAISFTSGTQESAVLTIRKMEEWSLRSELERLESSIDRLNGEVILRIGLLLPAVLVAVALARTGAGWLGVGLALLATGGLAWQAARRRGELRRDLRRSNELRSAVAEEISQDPDFIARREARESVEKAQLLKQREADLEAQDKVNAERIIQQEAQRAADLEYNRKMLELAALTAREAQLNTTERYRLADLREVKTQHEEEIADQERKLAVYEGIQARRIKEGHSSW